MSGSEQYDYTLNLDDGVKIADTLVKSGFSSKIDDFLQQLCRVTAVNDDAASDLLTRELIFKKIIDAVVVARKPLTDEDKIRFFDYIKDALKLKLNPLSIGINDKTLSVLIAEDGNSPTAAQHNSEILQLAQQLEENTAFFELTAAKYVQFDKEQAAKLTERCLELVKVGQNPKGVVYALALVNLEEVGMAMAILSALAEKGCATDMASFVHRLLPYVEGDDIENLSELLQQNLLQQNKAFEQQALYDYTARVYLQAVRSFAEGGYYEQSTALVDFLSKNKRLEGFEDDVKDVRRFIKDVEQKHLADEQQAASLQAKVEAMKSSLEEAKAKAEQGKVLEAEVVAVEPEKPVAEEATATAEVTPVEETAVSEETAPVADEVVATEEPITEEVPAEAQAMEEIAATEEMPVTEENMPVEEASVSEESAPVEDVEAEAEMPIDEEVAPVAEEAMPVTEEAMPVEEMPTAEENAAIEDMAITEETTPYEESAESAVDEGEEMSFEQHMAEAEPQFYEEPVENTGEEEAAAYAEGVEETADEGEDMSFEQHMAEADDGLSFEQRMAMAEDEALQEYIAAKGTAQNDGKSLRETLKNTLIKEKLDSVGETVLNIKEKVSKNNKINLNVDNLDKGFNILKDVTTSAIKLAGEQTAKVYQKVEDIVKNDDEKPVDEAEQNIAPDVAEAVVSDTLAEQEAVEEVAVAPEPVYEPEPEPIPEPEPTPVMEQPRPAAPATPKKVVSSFYEVPFWEREDKEELKLREQELQQSAPQNIYNEPVATQFAQHMSSNKKLVNPADPFAYFEEQEKAEQVQENPLAGNRIEARINERQAEDSSRQAEQAPAKVAEEPRKKPNFDDIDLSSVSNFSALDDFGYQLGEDLDEKK